MTRVQPMDPRLDLLATVAHDLRTPLASMQGYLELLLLRQGQLEVAEARNYLQTAVRQSERLARLVNDLFEWSRLEAGETRPNAEDCVLAELLHDVAQRFQAEAQRARVTLTVSGAANSPLRVHADIALVERALAALLENALHHTPAGGSVTIGVEPAESRVRVEVRDTGAGIAPRDLENIFAHYERSARITGAETDGQGGLGLAIARRIARLHGGELRIESSPGQGTRVGFDLPARTAHGASSNVSPLAGSPDDAGVEVEQLRRRLARAEQRCAAAQAAQRAIEQRYLLALRGAQDGLWEWDLATNSVMLSPRWKSMLGYENGELRNDRSDWLSRIHPDDRATHESALQAHVADPQSRFDHALRLLHKDGSIRHVLSRAVAIRHDDGSAYRVVGMDTDVTAVRRVQTVLDAVVEGTSGAFGAEFFNRLVLHFARALEVDCVFITECADHPVTRVRTLGYWSRTKGVRESFEFALSGTPCEAVVTEARTCFYPDGVGARFPRDKDYEAYVGLPIFASDGRVLGHLAIFHSKPRGEELLVDSVYRIFLARAASEIERLHALERLSAGGERPGPAGAVTHGTD